MRRMLVEADAAAWILVGTKSPCVAHSMQYIMQCMLCPGELYEFEFESRDHPLLITLVPAIL